MLTISVYIIDLLLLIHSALSAVYILIFSIAAKFHKPAPLKADNPGLQTRFLVLFPAYKEDSVIVDSVRQFLQQDYPTHLFSVIVMSDHMQQSTNDTLSSLPVHLLTLHEKRSSKGIALLRAMEYSKGIGTFDYCVIMDADNIAGNDFLTRLDRNISDNAQVAYQCHRCSKNKEGDVAMLDSMSEEINNSIFRLGHKTLGLSSALIGSGICIRHEWLSTHASLLLTAGEDREMEALLLAEGNHITYLPDIHVFDEKVSDSQNFQKQRLRWMTAQVQSFLSMSKGIPSALLHGNIDFIDKTMQQALIPRSLLISLNVLMTVAHAILWAVGYVSLCMAMLWTATLGITVAAILFAIPRGYLTMSRFWGLIGTFLSLSMRMASNILRINHRNTDFIHTEHKKKTEKQKTIEI